MKIIGVIILFMGIVTMLFSIRHSISEIKKTNTPREVVICSQVFSFRISSGMECHGDIENIPEPATIQALYHDGWKIDIDLSRAEDFVFILSREKAKVK